MVMVMSGSRVGWGDVDPYVAILNSVVIYCRCEDWTGWLAATTRLCYDLVFLVTFLISVSLVFLYCRVFVVLSFFLLYRHLCHPLVVTIALSFCISCLLCCRCCLLQEAICWTI